MRESIFYEALDCLSGMVAKPELRRKIYNIIGVAWSISPDRVNHHFLYYKPAIQVTQTTMTIGRATVVKNPKSLSEKVEKVI